MTDFATIWETKKNQLEELEVVYMQILELTRTAEIESMVDPLAQADEITGRLQATDQAMRDASHPLLPESLTDAEQSLLARVQSLNVQLVEAVEQQREALRAQMGEARRIQKTIDHYRPYANKEGKRLDCSM